MLALTLLLAAAPGPAVSPDGRFRFEISDDTVLVWRAARRKPLARLTGGRNVEARFVAGDNLLVTSSCGAPCEVAGLFTPEGRQLASLSLPEVSADGRFALDRDVLDLKTGETAVSVVDLRTGKRGAQRVYRGLFLCEQATVSATEVVYSECGDGAPIHVSFSPPAEAQGDFGNRTR